MRRLRQVLASRDGSARLDAVWMCVTTAASVAVVGVVATICAAVIVSPLPVEDGEQLFAVRSVSRAEPSASVPLSFVQVERVTEALAGTAEIAAVTPRAVDALTTPPMRLSAALVVGPYWSVVGARFLEGTGWSGDDARVCVLTRTTAARLFGALGARGQSIRIGSGPVTVVGVVDDSVGEMLGGTDIWLPLRAVPDLLQPDVWQHELVSLFSPLGRRRPAVVHERVQAALSTQSVVEPLDDGRISLGAQPLRTIVVPPGATPVLAGLAAVAAAIYVLALVAVAQLAMAWSAARARGVAIRAALGATTTQSLRPVVASLSRVVGVGALAGVALAAGILRALPESLPATWLPGHVFAPWGASFVGATVVTALGVFVAVALAAWLALRNRSARGLASADIEGAALDRGRLARFGLSVQVAATFVALVLAAAVASAYIHERRRPLGIGTTGVSTARVSFATIAPDQRASAQRRLVEQLSQSPGVGLAALTTDIPIVRFGRGVVAMEGVSVTLDDGRRFLNSPTSDRAFVPRVHRVTADYFGVFRIDLVAGQGFDRATAEKPALVSAELVRRYWLGQDPIGRRVNVSPLRAGQHTEPDRTVVGVVSDVRYDGPSEPLRPDLYLPLEESSPREVFVIAKGAQGGPTGSLSAGVRAALPNATVFDDKTMDRILVESMPELYSAAVGGAVVALVGLLFAVVTAYGAVALVARRQHKECAIRLALGASPFRVAGSVLLRIAGTVALGLGLGVVGVGLIASLGAGRAEWLSSLSWGLVASFGCALVVALAAMAIGPAARAGQTDVWLALRVD